MTTKCSIWLEIQKNIWYRLVYSIPDDFIIIQDSGLKTLFKAKYSDFPGVNYNNGDKLIKRLIKQKAFI